MSVSRSRDDSAALGGIVGGYAPLDSGLLIPTSYLPDVVQGKTSAGATRIPGLTGSADVQPSSPSAFNDEFDTFSGWTTLGTVDTGPNVTFRPSHVYMKRTTANTNEIDGIYKTAPTAPFTVTAKLSEISPQPTGNIFAGILLTESSPGKLWTLGFVSNSGFSFWNDFFRSQWTNNTTRGTTTDYNALYVYMHPFKYIRVAVLSGGTTADISYSEDGFIWFTPATAVALGLTVANAGLFVGALNASSRLVEACFDWIRFT